MGWPKENYAGFKRGKNLGRLTKKTLYACNL